MEKEITYLIRKFPADLHKEAKYCALDENVSLRDIILKALTEYLDRKKDKN